MCSFVDKGITSSHASKLDKFNLGRSNFLAARIIKHWNKYVGGVRHLPLHGAFKTRCVALQTHFDPAAGVRVMDCGGPFCLEV